MTTKTSATDWWRPTGVMQTPSEGVVKVREYRTPYEYANVEVWNPEGATGVGPHKPGYEMARNEGTITIREPDLIFAVSVVGSGCIAPGYVICEYLQEQESTAELTPRGGPYKGFNLQSIRRQRSPDLWGAHPCAFMSARPYEEIVDSYRPESSLNELLVRETTAHFEIEPTHRVVLRGGSGDHDHFSFRIIRTYLFAK